MITDDQLQRFRADTGTPRDLVYFNNARVSPSPRPVLDAIRASLDQEFRECWQHLKEEAVLSECRRAIADLIGASDDEIVITQSATHAFNLVVNGLEWQTGDHVVVTDLVYRSIMLALLRLREERGVVIDVVPSRRLLLDPEDFVRVLGSRTRMVVVPAMPTFCGVAQPVREIGKIVRSLSDAYFVINATQALGHLPLHMSDEPCDFLFGTSRKWLRGPRGIGMLFVRRDVLSKVRCSTMGYRAATWTSAFDYETTVGVNRFHSGDFPFLLLCGLTTAARYASGIGVENIWSYNKALARQARDRFLSLGVTVYDESFGESGTVPIGVMNLDADAVVAFLRARQVAACAIYEENNLFGLRQLGIKKLVRVSIHYFNSLPEVEECAAVLSDCIDRRAVISPS